ncbi:hypothetical protein CB0940_02835 [Cercospora beticola]|uniref:Uncharacterized protein n=1 Tax=Cercospora beticola TaxID=122368 RepID=A0A2G5I2X7_CERBT|nr:hypothetical protein CB0940_02835 [Cercospora beticola]PIA99098.1 hypothetical protein CB0940_02835 [Cercospora beticola]WPA99984.1 hypothetical protein RHO25_004604 [Cercospora beticola]CAK1361839.1 unnamed protein product [Cercospora beticola]
MLTSSLSFPLLVLASLGSAVKLPADGAALAKRHSKLPDYAKRNLQTIREIYNLTVYPNNAQIVAQGASAVPPHLFADQATGRVSPVGNFTGFDDSIEYFFSLAPTPQGSNGVAFYRSEVLEFTSGCPEVAASLVYFRAGHVDPQTLELDTTKPVSTLSQVAFWRFDDDGKVLKYHAWIPNLEAWTNAANGIDFGNPLVQNGTTQQLCAGIQQTCTGENQQYTSTEDCIAQLSAKPFGSFDEAWGDNVVCRVIHVILTKVRPQVHCPHVGPLGGSPPDNWKCVNIDYSEEYFDDDVLFGAPEGSVFTCGGPLLTDGGLPAGSYSY